MSTNVSALRCLIVLTTNKCLPLLCHRPCISTRLGVCCKTVVEVVVLLVAQVAALVVGQAQMRWVQ